jgi:hypothetical protein
MQQPPDSATASPPRSGRAAFMRQALVVTGISLAVALFLTAMDGRGFGYKLVYALAVGWVCSLSMHLGRAVVDGTNRRRALASGRPVPSRWWGVAFGAVLVLALGPLVGLKLGDALTGLRSPSVLDWSSAGTRITLALVGLSTLVATALAFTMDRLASAREGAEAAQRQAAEHQLRLLQSQLEPHMLFNTLANLRVLIGLDPPQAQAMLDRLIAFLRATLSASRSAAHPLATEFERLADYLALMGTRMGPRLQTQLDLPDTLRQVPVPPLLLQPLVENAIKHGLEPHVQGGRVTVQARSEGATLVLSVRDTGAGLHAGVAPEGTHFGLAQVRERLATLHGAAASLVLEPATDGGGGTLATVRLPLLNA